MAWLTIDRPEARNALSEAVRDGLFAGVRRFNADDDAPGCWCSPARATARSARAGT